METLRFLIVHSDALAANFHGRLTDRLADERSEVAAAVLRVNKKPASCQQDALRAAQKALPKLRFHTATVSVQPEVRPVKRPGRGRPKRGAESPTETVWLASAVVEQDDDAILRERRQASCFPLITSHVATEGWDDVRILAEYRHQGIVEGNTGFRWLKGPAAVAPMFLKTPTRMRALGLVMVLALMVRNYWQFRMRKAARDADETILHPFTKRPVTNLTAEMAMDHFASMQAVLLRRADDWVRVPRPFPPVAAQILRYLRVPEAAFWTPPGRKIGALRV